MLCGDVTLGGGSPRSIIVRPPQARSGAATRARPASIDDAAQADAGFEQPTRTTRRFGVELSIDKISVGSQPWLLFGLHGVQLLTTVELRSRAPVVASAWTRR